jgi:alcohol dehydrogenase, propanol-preferring
MFTSKLPSRQLFGGTVRELREVVALAESGRLTPIDVEFAPLDAINDVHDRLKRGAVPGRVVITP